MAGPYSGPISWNAPNEHAHLGWQASRIFYSIKLELRVLSVLLMSMVVVVSGDTTTNGSSSSSSSSSSARLPRVVIWTGNETISVDPFVTYVAAALETRFTVSYAKDEDDVSYKKPVMDVLLLPAPATSGSSPYPTSYSNAAAFLDDGGSIVFVSYWDAAAVQSYIQDVLTTPNPIRSNNLTWPASTNLTKCQPIDLTQAADARYKPNQLRNPVQLRGTIDNVTFPGLLYGTYGSPRGIRTLGCAAADVSGFHAMYSQESDELPLVEFAHRGDGTVYYMSYSWDDEGGAPKGGWSELLGQLVLEAFSRGPNVTVEPAAGPSPLLLQPGDFSDITKQESYMPVSRGRPSWSSGGSLTGLAALQSPVAPFNPVKSWSLSMSCHSLVQTGQVAGALWVAFDLGLVRPVLRATVQSFELGTSSGANVTVQMEVRVSNSTFSGTAASGVRLCPGAPTKFLSSAARTPRRVACPTAAIPFLLGRYVVVRLLETTQEQLAATYPGARLCGVDVWALVRSEKGAVTLASRHRPVCPGAPLSAPSAFLTAFSSRPPDNTTGALAVDGLYHDNRHGAGYGMCAISFPQDGPWFTIDLGAPQRVVWVELTKSAAQGFDQQLQGVYIAVHGNTTTSNNNSSGAASDCSGFGALSTAEVLALPTCGGVFEGSGAPGINISVGSTLVAQCGTDGSGISGRFVTIYRPPRARSAPFGYTGSLRLCEVDVYVLQPTYGLQQVSYNRPIDYGPVVTVTVQPDTVSLLQDRTYPLTAAGMITDGLKPDANEMAQELLCPRVYDKNTTASTSSYGAGEGVFFVIDMGASAGGYVVESVVVSFADSALRRDGAAGTPAEVASSMSIYVGNQSAGSLYNATATGLENPPCMVHVGLLSALDPLDERWYLDGLHRRRYTCPSGEQAGAGDGARYVVLMAPRRWQLENAVARAARDGATTNGSTPTGWFSPAICEVEVYARVAAEVSSSLTLVTWRPTSASQSANTSAGGPHLALRNPNTPARVASITGGAAPNAETDGAYCALADGLPARNYWVMDLQRTTQVPYVRVLGAITSGFGLNTSVRVLHDSWDGATHPADVSAATATTCTPASVAATGGSSPITTQTGAAGSSAEAVCMDTSGGYAVGRYVAIFMQDHRPLLLCQAYVYVNSTAGWDDVYGYAGLTSLAKGLIPQINPTGHLASLGGGVVVSADTYQESFVIDSLDTAPDQYPGLLQQQQQQGQGGGEMHRRRSALAEDLRRQLWVSPSLPENTSLWRVDLGRPQSVRTVVLYTQSYITQYLEYDHIQILIANTTNGAGGAIVTSTGVINLLKTSHIFECGGYVGRYVFISRTVNYSLPLSDIGVYTQQPGPASRVVSGRPTNQTGGVVIGPGGSSNAVSGLNPRQANETNSNSNSMTMSYYGSRTSSDPSPWWAVDLGVALPLSAVQITALTAPEADDDDAASELRNYEIRLSNISVHSGTEGLVVVTADTAPAVPYGSSVLIELPYGMPATRQLIIRLPPRNDGSNQTLELGQVVMLANTSQLELAASNASSNSQLNLAVSRLYDSSLVSASAASTAIDGAACGAVSGNSTYPPWMTMDFGVSQQVSRVELYDSSYQFGYATALLELRLGDVEVAARGNGLENAVVVAGPISLLPSTTSIHYLEPQLPSYPTGRYLTVRSVGGNALALCVTAFGATPFDLAFDVAPPPPAPSPLPPPPPSRSPRRPPSPPRSPPAPRVYQVGNVNSNSRAVQVAAAATIATTAAATVAASVAVSTASSTAASTVSVAGAGIAGGVGSSAAAAAVAASSIGTTGAVAASMFVNHLQFFALTPYAATNSTQQYRQVNSNLGWLNLGFSTVSMRNVPHEDAKAYNQILNNVAMLVAVVGVHYLLLLLYSKWGTLRAWTLPSWLAFPCPEIFALAFSLSSLSAAAAMLLASALVSGQALPAAVGSMVVLSIITFAAAALWAVIRVLTVARELGMEFQRKARDAAGADAGAGVGGDGDIGHGSGGGKRAVAEATDRPGRGGTAAVDGDSPMGFYRRGNDVDVSRAVTVRSITVLPYSDGSRKGWHSAAAADEDQRDLGLSLGASEPRELMKRKADGAEERRKGSGIEWEEGTGGGEEGQPRTRKGSGADMQIKSKAGEVEEEKEEDHESEGAAAGEKQGGLLGWMYLGHWNRTDVTTTLQKLEPHRTRKYLKDRMSLRAAVQCLYLHPDLDLDPDPKRDEDEQELCLRRRRQGRHRREGGDGIFRDGTAVTVGETLGSAFQSGSRSGSDAGRGSREASSAASRGDLHTATATTTPPAAGPTSSKALKGRTVMMRIPNNPTWPSLQGPKSAGPHPAGRGIAPEPRSKSYSAAAPQHSAMSKSAGKLAGASGPLRPPWRPAGATATAASGGGGENVQGTGGGYGTQGGNVGGSSGSNVIGFSKSVTSKVLDRDGMPPPPPRPPRPPLPPAPPPSPPASQPQRRHTTTAAVLSASAGLSSPQAADEEGLAVALGTRVVSASPGGSGGVVRQGADKLDGNANGGKGEGKEKRGGKSGGSWFAFGAGSNDGGGGAVGSDGTLRTEARLRDADAFAVGDRADLIIGVVGGDGGAAALVAPSNNKIQFSSAGNLLKSGSGFSGFSPHSSIAEDAPEPEAVSPGPESSASMAAVAVSRLRAKSRVDMPLPLMSFNASDAAVTATAAEVWAGVAGRVTTPEADPPELQRQAAHTWLRGRMGDRTQAATPVGVKTPKGTTAAAAASALFTGAAVIRRGAAATPLPPSYPAAVRKSMAGVATGKSVPPPASAAAPAAVAVLSVHLGSSADVDSYGTAALRSPAVSQKKVHADSAGNPDTSQVGLRHPLKPEPPPLTPAMSAPAPLHRAPHGPVSSLPPAAPSDGAAAGSTAAPPPFVALMSFGTNVYGEAYITGNGPKPVGSRHNSHASLAARPTSVSKHSDSRRSAPGESWDRDEGLGDGSSMGGGGRRFVPPRRHNSIGSGSGGVLRVAGAEDAEGDSSRPTSPPGMVLPEPHIHIGEVVCGAGVELTGRVAPAAAAVGGVGGGGASGGRYGNQDGSRTDADGCIGDDDDSNSDDGPSEGEEDGISDDEDNATTSGGGRGGGKVDDSAKLDAATRLLLQRTEVYERYGLTFEENQGNRVLAMTFYGAVLINALVPAALLGLQAGGRMSTGSSAALGANVALLVVKASYSLYLTIIMPYINVVLISAEVLCSWLETTVVVCMVYISVHGGTADNLFGLVTASTSNGVADAMNTVGNETSSTAGNGPVGAKAAGDTMLVCELIVLAAQIMAMFLTAILPGVVTLTKASRAQLLHWRAVMAGKWEQQQRKQLQGKEEEESHQGPDTEGTRCCRGGKEAEGAASTSRK